ncbi:MAG: FAD-binding oxidoreductase [Candidatus Micrarchaeia archaeon]|jgi:ferredoxin-NADP reductase
MTIVVPQTFDAKLVEKREEVPGVITMRLAPVDGRKLSFTPGQFAMLCFPEEADPARKCRAYSVSSSPQITEYVEVTIKVVKEWTTRMTTTPVGTTLQVKLPFGRFVMDEACADYVFIAGGVGITPFASMSEYLAAAKPSGKKAMLFYSAKTPATLIFREKFEKLSQEWPGLKLAFTITDKEYAGTDWNGHRGRLDAEFIKAQLGSIEGKKFYLCGSAQMMVGIEEILEAIGVAKENIHTEKFG